MLVGKKGQQAPFTRAALEREQAEASREDANLLYVAVTRARQHLYLSACAPRRGDELGWYGAMRQALDPLSQRSLDEPCLMQSGTPPELLESGDGAEAPTPAMIVPAGLSGSIDVAPRGHEIAPSLHQPEGIAMGSAGGDEDGRQRGIAIHRLLQLLSEDDAQVPAITARVAQELDLSCDDRELQQWAAEAQQVVRDPTLRALMQPPGGSAINEVPIIYQQGGRTVHGIIDRLLLHEDEAWVIDYKSHRGVSADKLAEQAAPFREQLQYYAEGVQRLWPQRRVRRFVLFTHGRLLYEFV
jgi:ATP-dependent helicase/nuclease subunit A